MEAGWVLAAEKQTVPRFLVSTPIDKEYFFILRVQLREEANIIVSFFVCFVVLNKMLSITLQDLASFGSPCLTSQLVRSTFSDGHPTPWASRLCLFPKSCPLITSLFYPTHNEEMQLVNQHRRNCCSKERKLNIKDTVSSPMKFTKIQ